MSYPFKLNKMDEKSPIYNSRLIRVYLEFIRRHYPNIDRDYLLEYAKMTKYEVNDTGHWFNQNQVDQFYEIITKKTGNPNISREAGRYSTSTTGMSALRQYGLGFMTLAALYTLMGKLYNTMSRGALVKAKKSLGRTRFKLSLFLNQA